MSGTNVNLPKDQEGRPLYIYSPQTPINLDATSVAKSLKKTEDACLRIVSKTDIYYLMGGVGEIHTTATDQSIYLPAGQIEIILLRKDEVISFFGGIVNVTQVI